MKIELQAGDTIAIPEGCKAIIKDESVVFEKEEIEKVQEFKDGDVLCSEYSDTMLIFREMCEDDRGHFNSYYNTEDDDNKYWNSVSFRHATEEEKQLLFDKMKEQGLKWNAEEKRVEKIRWRAKKGEEYHFMNTDFTTVNTTELGDDVDTNRYDALNYFHTKEQTIEAAKRVKETLRKFHEEIGE